MNHTQNLSDLVKLKLAHPNISVDIHESATMIAYQEIREQISQRGGTIVRKIINAGSLKGPDIEIEYELNGDSRLCRAEVVCNFNFKAGPEFEKLCADIRKLESSGAQEKILFVLTENQVQIARNRLVN